MTTHGEFEPYLNAETAVRRAGHTAEALGGRFQPIPDGEDAVVFKRIWTRTAAFHPDRAEDQLGDVLLAASTEKLAVITGGEYRGKDDPVLLAAEPLANAVNLFMRDRFYMTQGDGRGSHNMFPAKMIARITAQGSPYESKRRRAQG